MPRRRSTPPASTSSPASSTRTCTSTIRAGPTGRGSRPAPRAFAAGGGTCFFDMPLNAIPPTVDGASFDLKLEAAAARRSSTSASGAASSPATVDRLDELADRGVVGFKAFMCTRASTTSSWPTTRRCSTGMERAARLGLPVAVHAENDDLTRELAARARRGGAALACRDYLALAARVGRARGRRAGDRDRRGDRLLAARRPRSSTAAAVLLVAEARARGVDVTCETCPHYLAARPTRTRSAIGALAKCSPPLRPRAEVEALWAELLAGTIPFVASDHSPAPPELKEGDDAFAMWGGISGCQTLRSSLLAVAEPRGLTLEAVASLTSAAAGRALRARRQGPARAGLRRRPRDRRPRPRERARGRRAALPPSAQRRSSALRCGAASSRRSCAARP